MSLRRPTGAALVLAAALAACGGELVDPAPSVPATAGRSAAAPSPGPLPAASMATLREAAVALGRRYGVDIVVDAAVRADGPAPPDGASLESTLRAWFAGHELLFHVGPRDGAERLKAVWVLPRGLDPSAQARAVAVAAAPRGADAAGDDADADEPGRSDGAALLRLAESDPSDRVRLRSLDALVALDGLPPPQFAALLDRLADDPLPAVADHARGLREGASASPELLLPEAIE